MRVFILIFASVLSLSLYANEGAFDFDQDLPLLQEVQSALDHSQCDIYLTLSKKDAFITISNEKKSDSMNLMKEITTKERTLRPCEKPSQRGLEQS